MYNGSCTIVGVSKMTNKTVAQARQTKCIDIQATFWLYIMENKFTLVMEVMLDNNTRYDKSESKSRYQHKWVAVNYMIQNLRLCEK
jgi:hypothetical protein